jgi:hypothetical protein
MTMRNRLDRTLRGVLVFTLMLETALLGVSCFIVLPDDVLDDDDDAADDDDAGGCTDGDCILHEGDHACQCTDDCCDIQCQPDEGFSCATSCAEGTDCSVDCGVAGDCSVSCASTASCEVDCQSATCTVNCPDASCVVHNCDFPFECTISCGDGGVLPEQQGDDWVCP